jgi:hypothetical protein
MLEIASQTIFLFSHETLAILPVDVPEHMGSCTDY